MASVFLLFCYSIFSSCLCESLTPYFSIQGFLAAGPSPILAPIVLFLLSCSALKRDTLFPGELDPVAGSVWITMLAARRGNRKTRHAF